MVKVHFNISLPTISCHPEIQFQIRPLQIQDLTLQEAVDTTTNMRLRSRDATPLHKHNANCLHLINITRRERIAICKNQLPLRFKTLFSNNYRHFGAVTLSHGLKVI